MTNVYDLSKWNRIKDYSKFTKNLNGVILRCGYRSSISGAITEDPQFATFSEKFKSYNVPIGVYFFSTAITEEEAKQEAKFCTDIIQKYGIEIKFPIFIDTEYCNKDKTGRSDNLDKDTRTNIVKSFIKNCRALGYEAGIYASESWFSGMLNLEEIKDYKKWVAKYSMNTPNDKLVPMVGWQYTNKATADGIDGVIDCSMWLDEISDSASIYKTKTMDQKIKERKFISGEVVNLKDVDLFASSITSTVVKKLTGTYYIWDTKKLNKRVRITNKEENVNVAGKVTGWINISDLL